MLNGCCNKALLPKAFLHRSTKTSCLKHYKYHFKVIKSEIQEILELNIYEMAEIGHFLIKIDVFSKKLWKISN